MQFKFPKNDHKYFWTNHSKQKLLQYNLTPNLVKRVIRNAERKEEGIAPDTIVVMRRKNKKDPKKGETWVMYQKFGSKLKIISAWIYPGETKKGKEIFVPDEVWIELERGKLNNKIQN